MAVRYRDYQKKRPVAFNVSGTVRGFVGMALSGPGSARPPVSTATMTESVRPWSNTPGRAEKDQRLSWLAIASSVDGLG